MKIYAPNKNANGVYASVQFVNGVGETDNPKLIEWFKSHGYKVPIEEVKTDNSVFNTPNPTVSVGNEEVKNENDEVKPDFDKMSPIELREWMRLHGYAVGSIRSKEKLLNLLRG